MTLEQLIKNFLYYQNQTLSANDYIGDRKDILHFLNESYHSLLRSYYFNLIEKTVSLDESETYDYDSLIPDSGIALSLYSVDFDGTVVERDYDMVLGFNDDYPLLSSTRPYSYGYKPTVGLSVFPAVGNTGSVRLQWFCDDPQDLQSVLDDTYMSSAYFDLITKQAVYNALVSKNSENIVPFFESVLKPELEKVRNNYDG